MTAQRIKRPSNMQRTNSNLSNASDGKGQRRSSRESAASIGSQDIKKSQSRRSSKASSLNQGSIGDSVQPPSRATSGQAPPLTARHRSTPSVASRRGRHDSLASSISSRSSTGSQSNRPALSKRNSNVSNGSSASSSSSSSFVAYVSPSNAQELRAHMDRLVPVLTEWKGLAAKLVRPVTRPFAKPGTPSGSPKITAEDFQLAKAELVEAINEHVKACQSLLANLNRSGFSKKLAEECDELEDDSWNLSWIYQGLRDFDTREGQYTLAAGLNLL